MEHTSDTLNSQNGTDPDLLFVEENSQYHLWFSLQNKRMECLATLDFIPGQSSSESTPLLSPPDMFWFLQQNSIIQTIDYVAVYNFCADIDMGLNPDPTILARGIDPVCGADGWFELTVKISGEEAEFEEDEEGNIDLRNLNAYSEIEAGQKLGIVHPPKDGTPGIDVFGLPVPAEPGKPFELSVGEGVALKFDDRVAFAEKSGRALFEKKTISVVDQLVIPGDIDLSVGNIDFNGFVEIKGDVPDDFDVRATKGIKITGAVGACHIESIGSVEISSMAGKEIGRIICHGDLYANYLNQVTVLCYGNIYVRRELRNSQIKATGKVVVEQGSIIGGKCTAMEGIEAKNMGTSSGQKTQLVAGIYFPDADRFDYLREQLTRVTRQIKSINEALAPLKRLLRKDQGSSETAKLRLTVLSEQLLKLHEEKKHFTAEISASKPQEFNTINPKINILKKLMEGVFITLGDATEEIKIERSGPMSIIENTRDGGFRYLSLSPIHIMAKKIEEEIFADSNIENFTEE